jgi:hypothetical protein
MIRNIKKYAEYEPELIVCWGDTITHLESEGEIERFLADCGETLRAGGKLIISFRDYTSELTGDARFIPVKSDETRILTCFLEYFPGRVQVTDLLYEKEANGWKQKVSSYNKTRVAPALIKSYLIKSGLKIVFDEVVNRMAVIIARI